MGETTRFNAYWGVGVLVSMIVTYGLTPGGAYPTRTTDRDGKNRIVCFDRVSIGSLNQAIVHPREVFKTACLSNAAAILLVLAGVRRYKLWRTDPVEPGVEIQIGGGAPPGGEGR